MLSKTTISFIVLALLSGIAQSATITVSSYTHSTTPGSSGNYVDPSLVKLTDGVTDTPVWSNPNTPGTPSLSDILPLVGWQSGTPATTFDFGSSQTVQMVQVWAADSDGGAGVNLPSAITVRTPDSSFSQSFPITNPAGNGSMVRLDLTGFEVTTDMLVVESTRVGTWVMLTEVRFDTVPEPSSALLGALGFLGFTARRQRKQS